MNATVVELANLTSRVRAIVLPVLPADRRHTFGDEDDLLNALDSLHILRMVMSLEGEFGVKVEHADMTAENLGSIQRLAALMAEKCKNKNP
jgi:acyl carrier protein